MLEQIAIIALAIFNQFHLLSAEESRSAFLAQFVDWDAAETGLAERSDISREPGLMLGSDLAVLPQKVKSADPDLRAVSAFAMDADTDYPLYDKNSKKLMPIASLTKVMTALLVLENRLLDETVVISPRAMEAFGDKKNLAAGERIRLEDLLTIMIVDSNNAAAVALAEHAGGSVENFVAMMNEKARILGLANTRFVNPTGLDGAGADNSSTAFEMAQLADRSLSQDKLWEISRMPEATVYSLDKKRIHHVKNTDELLGKRTDIYGGKTGYTLDAGECLLLISETADGKHKVISVVLNAEDRFAEMGKLADWVSDVYRW